jgi:hypothetical protein
MGIGLKENRSRRQTEMARVIPNAGPVHPLHVVCKFKPRTCRRRKATPDGTIVEGKFTVRMAPSTFRTCRGKPAGRQLIGFGWEARRDESGRECAHTQHNAYS